MDGSEEDDRIQTENLWYRRWNSRLEILNKSNIPKRGEKEFEPDGTTIQSSALEESQLTMFNALNNIRGHHLKHKLLGVWIEEEEGEEGYCFISHVRGNYFKDLEKEWNLEMIYMEWN